MSLKAFSILSSGDHFVQQSVTIFAILVESHSRNIPVKLFQNPLTSLGEDFSQVRGVFKYLYLNPSKYSPPCDTQSFSLLIPFLNAFS